MDVKDKDGHFIIAQEKLLREAGIELPDPSKPEGRYNNRKITFDKTKKSRRVRLLFLCKNDGYSSKIPWILEE